YEPGHLHLSHVALQPTDISFDIHLGYEVNEDPKDGTCVHFTMMGEINGKPFEEHFQLTGDLAFNFADDASRIAIRHGLPS
ncbi:DUF5064 family protein, partial [Pseudomonas syringae pv. tagetis]|uniref:DUF5064 family protein n=1 Tax=Pseudomonas syringae group genomosp. 7 TaxID=251699 RepID=UPI0037700558